MTGRADWALERQLEYTEKQAVDSEVKGAIVAALHHMRSGRGRSRRGGGALVRLLEVARLRASEEGEWDIVRLLQDAVDYTTGRSLKPEFEERFQLFQDGIRNEDNRDFVRRIFAVIATYVRERGREFMSENSAGDAQELLAYLACVADDGEFLEAPDETPGRYRIVRGRAETTLWLERVLRNRIDIEDPREHARQLVLSESAITALMGAADGQTVLRAVELRRNAVALREIRKVVENPSATEHDLQVVLETQPWIFGGRYIATAARRRLVAGDEIDIPLIRSDGSLHIVELKRAMSVGSIVKRHRNAWVPTAEVHDAAAQAINYLVSLDENRKEIRDQFGLEVRRASATVLIGHPGRHRDVPEEEINEVFRTLSVHLNRVEVLTYKELLDSAERALGITD